MGDLDGKTLQTAQAIWIWQENNPSTGSWRKKCGVKWSTNTTAVCCLGSWKLKMNLFDETWKVFRMNHLKVSTLKITFPLLNLPDPITLGWRETVQMFPQLLVSSPCCPADVPFSKPSYIYIYCISYITLCCMVYIFISSHFCVHFKHIISIGAMKKKLLPIILVSNG